MRPGEIAAAWACCGMLALGALLGEISDARDAPSLVAVYAGAHLPGGGGAGMHDREPDELREDDQTADSPDTASPATTASSQLLVGEPSSASARDRRPCWYRLAQTLGGYSAAARLAGAGAAAGVREAAQ